MPRQWTDHQFVSGALALDLVNTVCYRADPRLRFDKLESLGDVEDFAAAAHRFAADRTVVPAVAQNQGDGPLLAHICAIREAVHDAFAPEAPVGRDAAIAWLLERFAMAGRQVGFKTGEAAPALHLDDGAGIDLLVVDSAISLCFRQDGSPIKRCPRCHWLLVDRSRNRSRTWCDMRSCGNVAKARRFQERQRGEFNRGRSR